MVYDSARGRAVLFGGLAADTWEYDGAQWLAGPAAPSGLVGRYYEALAYDSRRGRTVMFGGGIQHSTFRTLMNDTWEYDGTQWLPGPPAPAGLTARAQAGVAFDPNISRVVLLGGDDGVGFPQPQNDTWEYDGSAWIQGPAGGMSPRFGHAMAYDAALKRIVMFSGSSTADTWEFDGTAWRPGAGAPAGLIARSGHVMAYDSSRARIVMFGGFGGPSALYLNDTWEYDGTSWTAGPGAPASLTPRTDSAMTFHEALGRAVLFSGSSSPVPPMNDTWQYDGASWSGPVLAGLAPRTASVVAYDSQRARVVLFGGTSFNDTWEFDGASWTQGPPAPASLVPRRSAAVTFDISRGRTILFGGIDSFSSNALGDTWEYDGATWSQGAGGPSPRGGHGMAYDAARSRSVLFGGAYFFAFNDTWEYDGVTWNIGPPAPPTLLPRSTPLAYDSGRRLVVLFGGRADSGASLRDTWEYDGSAWRPGPPGPAGIEGSVTGLAYDRVRDRVVMVMGGWVTPGADLTWELDGATWVPGGQFPPALAQREKFAVTYSDATGVMLFGGDHSSTNQTYNDTWEYKGAPWTAQFSAAPTSGIAPLTVAFTNLTSGAPSGYQWDFGDGTSSTTASPSHSYLTLGSFTVTLQADGPAGSDTETKPGYVTTHEVIADFTAAPRIGRAPLSVQFTDQSAGNVASYQWDFGDGGTSTSPNPAHIYSSSGRYRVILKVSGNSTQETADRPDYVLVSTDAPADIVTGPGPDPLAPPHVTACDVLGSFNAGTDITAYGALGYGANVSGGDIDGGGAGEILTGPGPGAVYGPQVRAFHGASAAIAKINFYAYGTLRYGVLVDAVDVDGDGFAEILTGAGPGAVFGPHVRGFNYDGTALSAIARLSFLAYGTPRFGVNSGHGNVAGAGTPEILTAPGPGPSFAPQVRAFFYQSGVIAIAKINFVASYPRAYGGKVAGSDVDGDGWDEIVFGGGAGPTIGADVILFDFDETTVKPMPNGSFAVFAGDYYGADVKGGDLDGDGYGEVLAARGPDPSSDARARGWDFAGGQTAPIPSLDFVLDVFPFGVHVASVDAVF
ncbi:MAG: PKD domain-containing protein [Acidobacteriota bacterium]